jgi:hypothetical protein
MWYRTIVAMIGFSGACAVVVLALSIRDRRFFGCLYSVVQLFGCLPLLAAEYLCSYHAALLLADWLLFFNVLTFAVFACVVNRPFASLMGLLGVVSYSAFVLLFHAVP